VSKKPKTRRKVEKEAVELPIDIPVDVYEKFINDIEKSEQKVYTPYTIAQQYSIKISTARKMLREAVKRGVLKLYSGGRTPIYIKQ